MNSLKTDWPVYLSSAAIVVPLLSWFAKWLGIMANGGSTPVELIAYLLALPAFVHRSHQWLRDQDQV